MQVLWSGALVLKFPGSRPDDERMSFQRCHSPDVSQPLGCQPIDCVTECKLGVLAARQVSKLRDQLLGQVTATLVGKPADRGDSRLGSQRTILPELGFRLLLY